MSLRIIHCADVHMDPVMSGLDERKVNIRREELKRSFKKIIALAKNAHILLISGDLFDSHSASESTLAFLKNEFASIPETKVYIIAGNHDYLSADSVYRRFDFGKNVHFFGTEMEVVEEADYDIYGKSFKAANETVSMLSDFKVKNPDKINICLMHGNLGGSEYNPIKISDIEASGLDYLALGHVHKATEIKQAGATFYAYSGCPEGKGYDESGEKGVYAIELIKGNILSGEIVPVCERMYFDEEIDITDTWSYDEIMEKINEHHFGPRHIYRFTLVGKTDMAIDTGVLREHIEGFEVTVRDKTTPVVDIEKLAEEFSLKGLFAKFALEEKPNMTEEEFNEAIKAGLQYIEKEEKNENR